MSPQQTQLHQDQRADGPRPRIFMVGRDFHGWALDTEFDMTKKALERFAEVVDAPDDADVAHTVWPEQTFIPFDLEDGVGGLPLIAALNNDPWRLAQHPDYLDFADRHYTVVAQSHMAAAKSRAMGLDPVYEVPLIADFDTYNAIEPDDPVLDAFAERWDIPREKYLIGLFQRDSSGDDLDRIRVQKGTDVFLASVRDVVRREGGDRVHIVIGGPRRHWLRRRLQDEGIPYTYVGEETDEDDNLTNHLDDETMNLLFNIVDLYFIPTRWEGAPRQLLNVTSCRRKLLSMPVGAVPDLLEPECIVDDVVAAADKILHDIRHDSLAPMVPVHAKRVEERHSVAAAAPAWEKVYADVLAEDRARIREDPRRMRPIMRKPLWARALGRAQRTLVRRKTRPQISYWPSDTKSVLALPEPVLDALAERSELHHQDLNASLHVVDPGKGQQKQLARLASGSSTRRVIVRVSPDPDTWPGLQNVAGQDDRFVFLFPDAHRRKAYCETIGKPNRSLMAAPTYGDVVRPGSGQQVAVSATEDRLRRLPDLGRPIIAATPETWHALPVPEARNRLAGCGVLVAGPGTSHELIALAWHEGIPIVHDADVVWDEAAINARIRADSAKDVPDLVERVFTHHESYTSIIAPTPPGEIAANIVACLQR